MSFLLTELSGFGASANNPDGVPGLHLWLQANEFVSQGSGWQDVRMNGRGGTFSGYTGGVYWEYNGAYWIHFANNSVNSGFYIWMTLTEASAELSKITNAGEVTIIVVTRNSGNYISNETLCGFWNFSSDGLNTHHPYQNNQIYDTFGTSARKGGWTPPISMPGTWHIYSVSSKNGRYQAWLNKIELIYTETNTFSFPSTCYLAKSSGQAISGYPYVYTGDFAEILIYNKYLTNNQRISVENYLISKYKSNLLSYL